MINKKKFILAGMLCICTFQLECNDSSNPSSPTNNDPQNMIGAWKVDQVTEDGTSQSFNDTSMIFQITSNQMVAFSNMRDCYSTDTFSINISGNSVSVDKENGNLTFSGNKMTISSPALGTIVMSKYNGPIPPGNWPKKLCDSSLVNGETLFRSVTGF